MEERADLRTTLLELEHVLQRAILENDIPPILCWSSQLYGRRSDVWKVLVSVQRIEKPKPIQEKLKWRKLHSRA